MSDSPRISVLLPVRDGEKYIAESLDSIAAQGIDDMEVIIVNDGSTDRSVEIAADHELDPHIAHQPPAGYGAALNHLLSLARGQWLAFIDADDAWPGERLRQMLALAEAETCDWIHGQMINCDESLRPVEPPRSWRGLTVSLIRRDAANRVGSFRTDISHGANIDWIARAAGMDLRFANLEVPVLLRRIHDTNMGVTGRPKAKADLFRILRDHRARTTS